LKNLNFYTSQITVNFLEFSSISSYSTPISTPLGVGQNG
jgi:hypothetical protein